MLPRTTPPPPPAAPDPHRSRRGEQILLATATAYPSDIDSVLWLLPDDLTLPLHAGLWQCLTALARRNEPVDPVTVLWEAQQRGLLDDGSEPGEVLRMLAEPAGSVEHWGERALQGPHLGPPEPPSGTLPPTGRRMDALCRDVFEPVDGKIKRFDGRGQAQVRTRPVSRPGPASGS